MRLSRWNCNMDFCLVIEVQKVDTLNAYFWRQVELPRLSWDTTSPEVPPEGSMEGLRLMVHGGTPTQNFFSTFARVACLGPPRTPTYATTSWQGGEKCDSSTVIFGSWKSIKTELFQATNSCEPRYNYNCHIFVQLWQWNTKIFIGLR